MFVIVNDSSVSLIFNEIEKCAGNEVNNREVLSHTRASQNVVNAILKDVLKKKN